jgi:ectoine hydroxylase-related dioxygenase (phytanoyl-CoA dioxygenase family)
MYTDSYTVHKYQRDGYVLVENLFSNPEVAALINAVETGHRVAQTTRASKDADGRPSKLAIWQDLGDDIWSDVSTCPRIVNTARILLGEELSFFHGKVMLKEAKSGGAWEWHQDYGYWYRYQGFAFPRLISAFTALDASTRENGCLQVLRGSHAMGRLEHGTTGTQTGIDKERLALVEPIFERVYCEMTPGSVLFFHSNLLHSSSPNNSDRDRRAFITCYNALSNPALLSGRDNLQQPCPTGSDDWLGGRLHA